MGGHWGAELKFAGYDGIIIQGKAPEPVYLWVHNGQAEIKSASHLWGQFTGKADEELKREHGAKVRAMLIIRQRTWSCHPDRNRWSCCRQMGAGAVMGPRTLGDRCQGTGAVKVARPANPGNWSLTRHILGKRPLKFRVGQRIPENLVNKQATAVGILLRESLYDKNFGIKTYRKAPANATK
jgi:hypothetical protein